MAATEPKRAFIIFEGPFMLVHTTEHYDHILEEAAENNRYLTVISVDLQADGEPLGLTVHPPTIHAAKSQESIL